MFRKKKVFGFPIILCEKQNKSAMQEKNASHPKQQKSFTAYPQVL
jgi:hypothetical protein